MVVSSGERACAEGASTEEVDVESWTGLVASAEKGGAVCWTRLATRTSLLVCSAESEPSS